MKGAIAGMSVVLALAAAAPAAAQDPFVIQTGTDDTRLVFGLTTQLDGRFSLDDPAPITNTFTIRKARPTLSGRVAKYFDFKVMPDFGNGTAVLLDAYFDIRFSPKFRVRSGKDKTPVGYELLMGDGYLPFPERALPSSLVPNRDVGIQAQGDLAGGKVSYSAGVFNGVPDGTSSTADVDANNGKDVAGRVVYRGPQGFGVHVGGSTGTQAGALPAFRTSVGQTYFSYLTGVAAGGRRSRFTPAVFYYRKAFGAFAEFVRSDQTVTKSGVLTDLGHHGWGVTGSVVLTGEAASDRGIRPKNAFDPAAGHWGALQILARYSTLKIDPLTFTNGLAAAGASPDAASFTVAANWYPAAYIKYYLTFERTTFGAGATDTRKAEHVVLFRTQLSF